MACFLYNDLMELYQEWHGTLGSQKSSACIEQCLTVTPEPAPFRSVQLGATKRLLDALRARLKEEANQAAFLKQLRISNHNIFVICHPICPIVLPCG